MVLHAAVWSVFRTDNSRRIPDRIQVWLAPGCVGRVSLHQIIAAVQFHKLSRRAAKKTSLRKMSSVYVKEARGGGA